MSEFDDILTPDIRFHLVRRMERHKVIGLAGPALLAHERKYLEFHGVSGVILFERNVESLSQLRELVASVREVLGDDPPPLVMTDHEGDFVAHLRAIIGAPPSALAVAAAGGPELAHDVALETGREMRKLGVTTVLAPVADLFQHRDSPVTGLRTFGRDPERVAEYVAATVAGYREAGVQCCAKHFPGHGATADDSHVTLPEVRRSLDELRACELVPFRAAIDAGVDLVMTAHAAYPIDRDEVLPATFDARIVGGLLRDELGYGGVVITDALEMEAARWFARGREGAGMAGAFERALLAGVDLLLHTRPVPEQVRAGGETVMSLNVMETIIRTLERVVDRGRIDEKLAEAARTSEPLRNVLAVLDASWARVTSLRERAPGPSDFRAGSSGKVIELGAFPSTPAIYRDVAAAALSSAGPWRAVAGAIAGSDAVVVPVQPGEGGMLGGQDATAFAEALARPFDRWKVTRAIVDFEPDGEGVRPVFAARRGPSVVDATRFAGAPGGGPPRERVAVDLDGPVVLVVSVRGAMPEAFGAALERFLQDHAPALAVITGWPDARWLEAGVPVLFTLGATAEAAAAAARALAGDIEPGASLEGLVPEPPPYD